jgi:hypothetical protein
MVHPYIDSDLANLEQRIDELCSQPNSGNRILIASGITREVVIARNRVDNASIGGKDDKIHAIMQNICKHVSDIGGAPVHSADLHCQLARSALRSLRKRVSDLPRKEKSGRFDRFSLVSVVKMRQSTAP